MPKVRRSPATRLHELPLAALAELTWWAAEHRAEQNCSADTVLSRHRATALPKQLQAAELRGWWLTGGWEEGILGCQTRLSGT